MLHRVLRSPFCTGLRLFWVLPALLAGVPHAHAIIDGAPPPPDFIMDDAHALDPAIRRDMVEEIRALRADIKADVWFTASSFTNSGTNLRQQARDTRQRWSGDAPALLLAYDRTANGISLSFSPSLWERYPTSSMVELMRDAGRTVADSKLGLEDKLALVLQDTGKRLRQWEIVRIQQGQWFQPDEKRAVALLIGVLAVLAVGAALFGAVSRHRSTRGGQSLLFPEVVVGMRLGAPYGGGHLAQTQSATPSS